MADYLGAGTLVDDIPVKPEESFATKALRMGQSHASHFMQGGLDFADKLQPLPNTQRPNLFGSPEPSSNPIASATEEVAYDLGGMVPMTMLGTMMGGPVGGAAGAGLGLLKGLYKFGKLDTFATGLKHGAKALGAPEWLQETIKLGTQLVQPIFGTAKKILGMKQPAYAQSRELSQGAELDSFAYKNALANKVRKVRVKAGRGSDLLNAIIEDMEALGEDKSKVFTGERPNFKIKVHDALDRKIGLNELYQDIEKGQKTVTYGKNADGTPRHFTVTEGVKEGVAELNGVLREHIIDPYTQINPEFGEAFGVAEGIHKGESSFLAAKENLSKNKSWRNYVKLGTPSSILFGTAGGIMGGYKGAAIGLGIAAAPKAAKDIISTSKVLNLVKHSPKAQELYGKAFMAAANNAMPEFMRITKQLDKLVEREDLRTPEYIGAGTLVD